MWEHEFFINFVDGVGFAKIEVLMFLFLLLAFTVIPFVELSLLFEVGRSLGGWMTLWIVLLTGVVGASLAKAQGQVVFFQIQKQMEQGVAPTKSILEGFLVFSGGLLLLTPGFITDAIGLAMVIPGSRHILGLFLKKWISKKIKSGHVHIFGGSFSHRSTHGSSYSSPNDSQILKERGEQPPSMRDVEIIEVKPNSDDEK